MIPAIVPAILGVLSPLFKGIVEKAFPNPEHELRRVALANELQIAVMSQGTELQKAASSVILAEAQGGWLQRNWRPITMMIFVTLIVCRWFGFVAPNLAPAEYIKLWDIVEFGLGGYVVGRSVETTAKTIAEALKKK